MLGREKSSNKNPVGTMAYRVTFCIVEAVEQFWNDLNQTCILPNQVSSLAKVGLFAPI